MDYQEKVRDIIDSLPDKIAESVREQECLDLPFCRKAMSKDADELNSGERAAVQWVSTRDIDRDKEILVPEGCDLKEFRKNPTVLWGHDHWIPPVGSAMWIKLVKTIGIKAKTQFAETPLANDIWSLVKDGHLRSTSVGFMVQERVRPDDAGWADLCERLAQMWGKFKRKGVRAIISKWTLLEYSQVAVPSNPAALTIAVAKGLKLQPETLKSLDIEVPERHIRVFQPERIVRPFNP